VRAPIKHEVARPDMIDACRRERSRTTGRHTSPRPFARHLQPGVPPQAIHSVRAEHVATALQEDPNGPIAVPRVLSRERPHWYDHRRVSRHEAGQVAERGPSDGERAISICFA
jgi:hypothetical protein